MIESKGLIGVRCIKERRSLHPATTKELIENGKLTITEIAVNTILSKVLQYIGLTSDLTKVPSLEVSTSPFLIIKSSGKAEHHATS